MINLSLGSNEVVLTLSENTTISNPYYLFAFYSQQTKQTKYFHAKDQNKGLPAAERFNKFTIELVEDSESERLDEGVICLPNEGFYEYTAYAQETSQLTPGSNAEIVEIGKVLYQFSDATLTTYSPDIDLIVYNG